MSPFHIILIADTSGSTSEYGKHRALSKLCQYAVQRLSLEASPQIAELSIISWGAEAREIIPRADSLVALPNPTGKLEASVDALCSILQDYHRADLAQGREVRVLLLTDVLLSDEVHRVAELTQRDDIPLAAVVVGTDSPVEDQREALPEAIGIWQAEDVASAWQALILYARNQGHLPQSVSELADSLCKAETSIPKGEDGDEW